MMILALYHQDTRRIFLGIRGKESPYGHQFGGAAHYAGLAAFHDQPPVHLLFRLNRADPAVGVTLAESQWLPLLCAIRYGACDLAYRVLSDGEVQILHQEEDKAWDDFPYDGYPEKLPAQTLALAEARYDPGNPSDALRNAGIFGYEALTPDQYAELVRYVIREGYDPDIFGWESPQDYLQEGNSLPFVQGRPDDDCPEPACANHGRKGSLRVFAIFEEENKYARGLWGPHCDNLQIIYQICPLCGAIHTSNQCT
jgi:hypothetical protein